MEITFKSDTSEKTRGLGIFLSSKFHRGDVILLKGDLGAGKTTFASGVAKGLGIEEEVISPTFNIMKCYFKGSLPLYHIDAYRLEGQNIEIGLDEYIEGDGVCLIEWPNFIEPLLPDEFLEITIKNEGGDNRLIKVSSEANRYYSLIESLREEYR